MSFNKTKAMRSAERYLTQGKIQAAINEYRQIVDHEPKDVNSLNMLGDLYVKAKNDGEAATCYKRVAEYYNGQGFAKKAIAIYNKIHRIEPNSIEVSSKLAELYRMRGSYAEARNHYQVLAAYYDGKGQKIEALAMWESIAELDPNNAEIYLKIAESYWNDGRESDASDAFVKAGKRLSASGNHESAVTALSRALEIDHSNSKAVEELVRSQIALGYPEEAAKILEKRIESEPYDRQTNFLLVDCYYDMENPYAAENVIVKMVERDPSNYRKLLDLTDVYFKIDDLDSAVRIISMISEHMLVGGEHDALLVLIEEVLTRNPEHIAALRLLARYHAWLKDEGELKSALERLAESANINGAEEDEYYALTQLVLLIPHDTVIASRIGELKSANHNFDSSPGFTPGSNGDVPNFESYAVLSGSESVTNLDANEASDRQETLENAESGEFSVVSKSEGEDTGETLEAEIVEESYSGDVVESSAAETENGFDFEHSNDPAAHSTVQDENELIEQVNKAEQAQSESPVQDAALSAADEMRIEEELESIRFYLEQGYTGLADKSITELETEFGSRSEIASLRAQLAELDSSLAGGLTETPEAQPEAIESNALTSEEISHFEAESTPEGAVLDERPEEFVPEVENAASDSEAMDSEIVEEAVSYSAPEEVEKFTAESEYDSESAVESEPVSEEYEEYNAYAESIDEVEGVAGSNESFDEPVSMPTESIDGTEVSESDAAEDVDIDGGAESEVTAETNGVEAAEEDSDFSNSFENLRDELGLEETAVEDTDDFDNHYHHAVAYQEMGLMEEAIREYQDAINTVSPDDGTRRFLNCCTLLAHCFMEKGMANLGVVWLEKAFESTGLSAEELNGLHYELANAYETGGEHEKAVEEFEKIYAVDVDYRDVGSRIEHLRENEPAAV